MRSYLTLIISFASVLVLLTSPSFTNMTFSQVGPAVPGPPKLHLVKITSPAKGQQVPVGKDLVVSGTSASNKTAGCEVSVKVNFINPYHVASPVGVDGSNDYSKWNFILSSAYTTIKPGQNKITAKFACADNPTLASHYSVNVTGVNNVASVSTPTAKNNIQQISSVGTLARPTGAASNSTGAASNSTGAASNSTGAASNSTGAASNSTGAASNSTNSTKGPVTSNASFSTGATNINLKPILVSVHLGKSSLHPGDKQTITTDVADKNSDSAITGALVSEKVTYGQYGPIKKFEGTTDNKGKSSYSWTVSKQYNTGTYKVKVQVSAPSYERYSTWKTFNVTPVHHSVSSDNFIRSTSDSTNNDNHNDHHSNIVTSENTNINNYNQYNHPSSSIVTSTSENTNPHTRDQHSGSIIGGGSSIRINPNSGDQGSSGGSGSGGSSVSNSIQDNHKGNGGGSSVNQNVNGLAQKIINNVKDNLNMHGIHLP